jgi:hypothetical protein
VHNPPLHVIASLLAAGAVAACASHPKAEPAPVTAGHSALAQLSHTSLDKRNEPLVRYVVQGNVYYFLRSPCCDMPNYLYDELGNYVCAPNGGFTGQGDGKCPALREALKQSRGEQVPNPFYKP